MAFCNWAPHLQGAHAGSDAWPVSYKTVGSSSSAIERRALSASELSLIHSLRDQLRCAQQELKTVTSKVDVALSKALLAVDAEKFLLGEIENLGKAMECKFFQAPDMFFFWLATSDRLFLSNIDACLDSEAEAQRVNAHLRVAHTHANSITDNFWANRSKAMKLTILQDRIS
jgi:hypothetical protein